MSAPQFAVQAVPHDAARAANQPFRPGHGPAPSRLRAFGWRLNRGIRQSLLGPQGLALLSGTMLSGYWYGGEGLMLVTGLALPAALALASIAATRGGGGPVDPVTGLPLRRAAEDEMDRLLTLVPQAARATACLTVEIDDWAGLKAAQDPAAADEILARVADRLRGALREGDLLARLDGAAFAVVPGSLRRADLETVLQLAARLQGAVAEPVALGATRLYVTAAVGLALPSQVPATTGPGLLNAAECALAEARAQGPGTIRAFSSRRRSPRLASARLVDEVAQALAEGQIQAWYQPQVSTDTGEVSGFEALARWMHPVHGVIAPAEFLPAVAAAGQMDRLSVTILGEALVAMRNWERQGLSVPTVSVNLNADDLADPAMPERVRWELDRYELTADRLVVEVLEDVLTPGEDEVILRNIARLAEMGVGIDLDDFGTGTASIAAIRRFDVHRIKIDRSYVTRLDQDRGQHDMVAAILSMADRLGLKTLAEGVETPAEHAMLAQLGCDTVQGFGVAAPMPFDDTADWMRAHAARVEATRWPGRRVM